MSPSPTVVVGALAAATAMVLAAPAAPLALWIAVCGLLLMAGGGWIGLRRGDERSED